MAQRIQFKLCLMMYKAMHGATDWPLHIYPSSAQVPVLKSMTVSKYCKFKMVDGRKSSFGYISEIYCPINAKFCVMCHNVDLGRLFAATL